MKKISVILAAMSAILLMGTVSCNREPAYDGLEGTGKVVISFNFDKSETRYTPSTSIPGTTWKDNIKSLTLFLADASGVVKVALPVPEIPQVTSTAAQTFTFSNVPAGEYTGYLVANYDQTGVTSNFAGSTVGQNISAMLMNMVALASWPKDPTTEATATAYEQAGEIFLAIRPDTDVVANETNDYATDTNDHFKLTRAVSMLRVRIKKDFPIPTPQGTVNNNLVDFEDATASLRIRRVGTGMKLNGDVTPEHPSEDALIYSAGWNTDNNVPTGYTAGNLIDIAGGQHAWKDVRIYPGGGQGTEDSGTNPGDKFNILIAGMAPIGYYPAGSTTPLTAKTLVYWQGTIDKVIAANKILEVNVELKNQGGPDITEPAETGELIVGVDLVPWEMETPITIEM